MKKLYSNVPICIIAVVIIVRPLTYFLSGKQDMRRYKHAGIGNTRLQPHVGNTTGRTIYVA